MPVLGLNGLFFDHSSIGGIFGTMNASPGGNLLFCDGTQYFTYDYSPLGIPYQRLQQVLFNSTLNGPFFGTGSTFVNVYQSTGNTANLILNTNQAGSQSNPVDGTTTTGFTFNTLVNTGGTSINYNSYSNSQGVVTSIGTVKGPVVSGIADGTAGNATGMILGAWNTYDTLATYNGNAYSFAVNAIAANSLANGSSTGKYFTFGNTTTNYFVWFKTASETIPSPPGGGTGIQCNLTPGMSAVDVGNIIAAAIARQQTNTITVTGVPPAGSWFKFQANSISYSVWYQINGVGIAPAGSFANLIQVSLIGTETNAQVAFKTQTAINSFFFAVPDLRGAFLRGSDPSGIFDADYQSRYGYFGNTLNTVGTFELFQLGYHNHTATTNSTLVLPGSNVAIVMNGGGTLDGLVSSGDLDLSQPIPTITSSTSIGISGGTESRPYNAAVNWYIRY
jgi:hypothetical protein